VLNLACVRAAPPVNLQLTSSSIIILHYRRRDDLLDSFNSDYSMAAAAAHGRSVNERLRCTRHTQDEHQYSRKGSRQLVCILATVRGNIVITLREAYGSDEGGRRRRRK